MARIKKARAMARAFFFAALSARLTQVATALRHTCRAARRRFAIRTASRIA